MIRRALKWTMGALLALAALAAIAVELVSWNFLKPAIADRIEQATGREAVIGGDVSLSLLPRPRLSIESLSLANPAWARHPRFIEIEKLQIAPGLVGLLMGRVNLAQVDVDAPLIRLTARSDGAPNWVLEGVGNDGSADAVGDSVIVGGLAVSNAVIRYRPPGAETDRVFEIPSLRLGDDGDSLSASAIISAGDQEIELEAETDSLFAQFGARESFQGEIRARAGDSRMRAEFSASGPSPLEHWDSRVEVDLQSDLQPVIRRADLMPGMPAQNIGPLMLTASLQRSGPVWKAERIEMTVMESSLKGRLSLDVGEEVPVVEGALESRSINVAALQAAMGSDESRIAIDSLPVLPPLAGTVELEIAQIAGMAMVFTDFSARLELAERRLAAEQLSFAVAGGKVEGAAEVTSAPDSLQAGLDLSAADIRFGDVASGLEAAGRMPEGTLQGRLKGRLAASLGPIDRASLEQAGSPTAMLASNFRLPHAEFSFEGNRFEDGVEDATRLSINADVSPESTVPSVSVSGVVASRPLDLNIEGDPLADFESGSGYALKARASSGGLALAVDTTLEAVVQPAEFSGHVSVHAENGRDLERWTGRPVMALPAFDVTAGLQRRGELWTAEPFRIEIAETDLQGQLRFSASERPRFDAELTTETLDLAGLSRLSRQASSQAGTPSHGNAESSAARGVVDLSVLRSFDATLDLSASEVALPDLPALRQFELDGTLDGGELNVDSLGFELAGGTVALQGSMDVNSLPASARMEARFSDLALGRMADTFTPLEERLGLLSGELHAIVTQSLDDAVRDDVIAPVIGRLKIEPSTLQFADAEAGTELRITAQTRGLEDGEQQFEMDGRGTYDGDALSIRFRGDALLDARLPDRPYSVDLDARAVESRIELDGTLLRPLSLAGMDLELLLKGPGPERLSRLLGVPLPELPRYELSGRLGLDDGRWSLSNFDGTVGESDLRGRLQFDAGVSPPRLTGRLRSDSLDIEDFGEIFGVERGSEAAGTIAASEEGRAQGEDRYVLPDGPFAGDAWRQVNADVQYRGASVRAGDVPLSEVVVDFRLKDGMGKFEPVGFGVGDGRLDFTLALDANQDPPTGTLGVRVRSVDLRDALRDWDLAEESVGIIAAEGKFWVRGRSVAALLGSADGGLVILMAEGSLDALLVELAGLDAGEAFLSWVGERDTVPINCTYVDLQSRQGSVRFDTFVVDTPDTIFTAGGHVDMNDERVDVSIIAHPRDASVLVGRTPLHVGGTFDAIEVGIHGGELGVRAGASAALGAIGGPLGALLPLLDVGDNEGKGYCQGLASRTLDAIKVSGPSQ